MERVVRADAAVRFAAEQINPIGVKDCGRDREKVLPSAIVGKPARPEETAVFCAERNERPIVAVAKKPGAEVTREDLLKFYEGKTAKWQIPDDVIFVDAIPLGATGKMLKTRLREQLAGYRLPGL